MCLLSDLRLLNKSLLVYFSRASITFLDRDGDKKTVSAKNGESLLDVAKNNDIDLEGCRV